MYRLLLFLLIALPLPAQTPPQNLDRPPQDVDDALRARIKQFYDYHVAAKYRLAEQLITEESKDDFYVLSKPELKGYRIGGIEYSDNFTKAKVVIVGTMPALLPMSGGKFMDFPFASYWMIENGLWCWYYNKQANLHTPFGDLKAPQAAKPGASPAALPAPPNITVAGLQSALKVDKTHLDLVDGQPQTIRVTNTLPGPASLSIDCPNKPIAQTGITATFDKKDLKGNDTAVLTLTADPSTPPGGVPLQIRISPTNQVLDLTINISRR